MKRNAIFIFFLSLFMRLHAAQFALNAEYIIENTWPGGYQVLVTVKNSSNAPTESWKANFSLPKNHKISDLWNGVLKVNGQKITVFNPAWIGGNVIPAGGQTTFGMIVQRSNATEAKLLSLTATANGSGSGPTLPVAPVLNAINPIGTNYIISWNAATGASSYTLEQDANANFSNPQVIFNGSALSFSVTGAADGTYSYRVKASNAAGSGPYSNVQSVTIVTSPPQTAPLAPTLNPITKVGSDGYVVSWTTSDNATGYTLEQGVDASFNNSTLVFQGGATSFTVTSAAVGTYFYRVRASNAVGSSNNSNVQSVTISGTPPPVTNGPIVEGYWESWNSWTIPYTTIANMQTDVINISFGNFRSTGNHTFEVAGVEAEVSSITGMVAAAHALGKQIKIAIGGISYPIGPQLKSDEDAIGMAAAIKRYIQTYSLDGVDFDIEDFPPSAMEVALIKRTREALGNGYVITYTPMSPASTTEPFASTIRNAHQYIDGINIMAYNYGPGYTYQEDVANLLKMGVPASKIVVGLMPGSDDVGKFTSVQDIKTAATFVKQNGLRGIMFWSLDRDHDNRTTLGVDAATKTAYSILH